MNKIVERIKEIVYDERGLTWTWLARNTGINKATFTQWTKRDTVPSVTQIQAIAKALDIDVKDIIEEDGVTYAPNSYRGVPIYSVYNRENKTEFSIRVGTILSILEKEHGYSEEFVAEQTDIDLDYYRDMKAGYDRPFDIMLWFTFAAFYDEPLSTFVQTMMPVDNIGMNMAAIREIVKADANKVAEFLGIDKEEYLRIESGVLIPSFYQIQRFADYFLITTKMVVGESFEIKIDDKCSVEMLKWCYYHRVLLDSVGITEFTEEETKNIINYIKFEVSKRG